MTGRNVQRLPKAIDIADLSVNANPTNAGRRQRPTLTAFLTGLCLLALGFCSLEAGIAAGVVNKSNSPISFVATQIHNRVSAFEGDAATAQGIVWTSLQPSANPARNAISLAGAIPGGASPPAHSVCVRLCDGYYFPIAPLGGPGDLASHAAACSGLCPDAPTQLFVEPAGSDRIEDAVTSDGARYTALPVAFRNRTTLDNTCTCHRHTGQTVSLLNDSTLRKGDSIMTSKGILVFRGGRDMPYSPDDFVTLANASMPRDKREVLAAMERATLPHIQQTAAALFEPNKSQIAFAGPTPDRSKTPSGNHSIHFVEARTSSSN